MKFFGLKGALVTLAGIIAAVYIHQEPIIPEAKAFPFQCPPFCIPTRANCNNNLVITSTQPLSFGYLSAPIAGTVTVDTLGVRTATGGVVLISGGTVSPATFSMSTAPYTCTSRRLAVVSVNSPTTLTGPGPAMTLDTFVTTPVAGDRFDPAVPLTVGGTLHVGALQTPGAYSGNIQVTVTFQ